MAKRLRKSAKSANSGRSGKKAKADEGSEQDRLILDQLKDVGARIGLEVREERLVREVGYSVHSGRCRVKGVDVILLDRNVDIAERTDALIESLAGCDLTEIYVEPELRRLIQAEQDDSDGSDGSEDAHTADDSTETARTDEQSSGA